MKIILTSVYVSDQDRALDFYTKKLGFVKKRDIPFGAARWLTLVAPDAECGTELVLEPEGHPAVAPFKEALAADGIPFTCFGVDDIRAEYERLRNAGVTFTQPPTAMGPVPASGGDAARSDAERDKPARAEGEPSLPTITPMLMFAGRAEEAMTLYVSLFKNSQILGVHRWGAGEPGGEGKIKHAVFSLDGQMFRCMDTGVKHDFKFTPSTSFFINCVSEEHIDALHAALSKNGKVLTPVERTPFARKYAWVEDRFGVSWQLYLAETPAERK